MDITSPPGNAPLHLSMVSSPGIYPEGMAASLAEICVPFSEAEPGDVIAITQTMKATRHGIASYPITHLVRINDDAPSYLPRLEAFTSLPEHLQSRAALACMKAQCASLDLGKLERIVGALDPGSGEPYYFDLVMTPHYAFVVTSQYQEDVLEGAYHGEERDQEQVDMCFRLVLPEEVSSNHALLSWRPVLEEALCLHNLLHPVHDDEGEITALGLPDLSGSSPIEVAA